MIFAILAFFLIVAFIGGFFLITAVLKDQRVPKSVAMIHGSIAVIAILMLTVFVITRPVSYLLLTSLGLFVLAALGGITMFILDVNKKRPPKIVVLIHPAIALTAIVLLILYVLQITHP